MAFLLTWLISHIGGVTSESVLKVRVKFFVLTLEISMSYESLLTEEKSCPVGYHPSS